MTDDLYELPEERIDRIRKSLGSIEYSSDGRHHALMAEVDRLCDLNKTLKEYAATLRGQIERAYAALRSHTHFDACYADECGCIDTHLEKLAVGLRARNESLVAELAKLKKNYDQIDAENESYGNTAILHDPDNPDGWQQQVDRLTAEISDMRKAWEIVRGGVNCVAWWPVHASVIDAAVATLNGKEGDNVKP